MRILAKRLATVTLAAACVFVSALSGCEKFESSTRQADKQVDATIARGLENAQTGSPTATNDKTLQVLRDAASISGASPASRADANYVLGERAYSAALARQSEVGDLQVQIDYRLRNLDSLADSVATFNRLIAAEKATDPKDALSKIDAEEADLNTKQTATQADIDKLTADIAAKQKEIDSLTAARNKSNEDSNAQKESANQATGKQALDLYNGGIALHEDAEKKGALLDIATAQLPPMQRALAGKQAELAIIQDGIKTLDGQKAIVNQTWADTQARIKDQTDKAAAAPDAASQPADAASDMPSFSGGRSPISIADGVAAIQKEAGLLGKLIKTQDEIRTDIDNRLDDAGKHAAQAAQLASAVHVDMQAKISAMTDPDVQKDFRRQAAMYDSHRYELLSGRIEQARGALFAEQYTDLQMRATTAEHIAAALTPSGQTVSEDSIDKTKVGDASKAANEAATNHFNDALTHLDKAQIEGGDTAKEDSNDAKVVHVYAQFGVAQMLNDAGKLDAAKAAEAALHDQHILGPGVTLPTAASSDVPATAPADTTTAPADTGAPATPAPAAPAPAAPAPATPAPATPAPAAPSN